MHHIRKEIQALRNAGLHWTDIAEILACEIFRAKDEEIARDLCPGMPVFVTEPGAFLDQSEVEVVRVIDPSRILVRSESGTDMIRAGSLARITTEEGDDDNG